MPPTLDATVGGATSNSYLTHAEANAYFESRVPLAPPWIASGQEAVLIMATRTLDALAQPWKTLFPGPPPYYRVRRQWTGLPATSVQRLAWPRVQMFDQNGNPIDVAVEAVSVGNPATVTTAVPHLLETGEKVLLWGVVDVLPTSVNYAERVATVTGERTFTVPVNVTQAGTGGRVTYIPLTLKEATAELAGQFLAGDRTLDNDVIIQGIQSLKAGSVAISFNKDMLAQVIPQAVYDMLPSSWLTAEGFEYVIQALFDVVSIR
jgi:hypothetical protein